MKEELMQVIEQLTKASQAFDLWAVSYFNEFTDQEDKLIGQAMTRLEQADEELQLLYATKFE